MSRPSAETDKAGSETTDPIRTPAPDDDAGIAALRARGAQRLDPVRFRFIEALARRAMRHQGALRQTLDAKLASALAAYRVQYASALGAVVQAMPGLVQRHPDAAAQLQRLHADGDLRVLRGEIDRLEFFPRRGPLGDLVELIDRQCAPQSQGSAAFDNANAGAGAGPAVPATPSMAAAPTELKALRQFRDTWIRLSVERQLSRSQEKVPENPGPLNSHLLVLRALRRMQEISPAYLERYMAHVETLLWLQQARVDPAASSSGKAAGPAADKKRKPARGRQG